MKSEAQLIQQALMAFTLGYPWLINYYDLVNTSSHFTKILLDQMRENGLVRKDDGLNSDLIKPVCFHVEKDGYIEEHSDIKFTFSLVFKLRLHLDYFKQKAIT